MRAVAGNIVRYETDPITGGIDLLAGGQSLIGGIFQSPNTVMLLGDSMGERGFYTSSGNADAVNNGDGTATITYAATPIGSTAQTAVGDTIRVNNSATPLLNQISATVTAVSTSSPYSVTYTITGAHSDMVGSGTPFIVSSRSCSTLGFWPYLSTLANGDLELAYNCTQGGAAISEVSTIFSALVTTPVRFGIFIVGRNDIYARSATYAETIAAAKLLIDLAMAKCRYFFAITTPPQDSTLLGGIWTTERMRTQLQYEKWLADYVRSKGGYVVDAATASSGTATYRDSTSANANPTSGWTADGTHQAGISSYALGKAIHTAMSDFILPVPKFPANAAQVYANDPSVLTDNCDLAGTGGTVTPGSGSITGTAPTGTTVAVASGTAAVTTSQIARTVAADGDTFGNWLRMVITNASSTSQVTVRLNFTADRFTAGLIVRALARLRISSSGTPGSGNPIGLIGCNLYGQIIFNPGTGAETFRVEAISGVVAVGQALNEGFSGVLNTLPVQLRDSAHSPVSSGFILLTFDFSGAGGATVDIAHPHVRRRVV